MGLRKPGLDTYRIQTTDTAPFFPAAMTVCGWGKLDSTAGTPTMFRTFDNAQLGVILRVNGTDVQWFYKNDAPANTNALHTPSVAIATGVWRWFVGGVDASGNWVVGIDGEETTGSSNALKTTGTQANPTIGGHQSGTTGHEWIGTWGDMQVFSRLLSVDERRALFYSEGASTIVSGRVSRLRMFDAAPGVDTDTTLPVDAAVPGRPWVVAGTGSAYVHTEAPYPVRRRAV